MLARLTSALAAVALDRDIARDVAATLARGALGKTKQMVRTVSRSLDLQAEKVVSHKYRCLWLCNPKVASRSIKTTLLDADPAAEVHEASVSDLYARLPEVRSYYSFAFVRHPFTRALSFYSDLRFSLRFLDKALLPRAEAKRRYCPARWRPMGVLSRAETRRRVILARYYGLADANDFDAYCRWLNTPWGSDAFADRHFLSQHVQIRLDDRRLPDFVGRYENLDADFRRVASRLGIDAPALPVLNTLAGWQATPETLAAARSAAPARLTEQNKALLRARYAEDLALGDYPPA